MIKKLIRLFLILAAILMLPSASGVLAKDAQVTALRWTSRNDGNPPFVRIAMDLSKAVHAEAAIDDAGKNFEVVLKKTSMGRVASQYDMDPRAIDFATLSEKDGDTYLDVALSKPQKIDDIRVFALRPDAKMKKPHRLVVDIPVIGAKQTYTKKASSAVSSSPASSYKKQSYNVSSDAKSVLKGKIICIDPGHGGTDVGAIGHIGGKDVYEKNITLSIALPLRDMLTSAGAKVVMTRDTDKDVYGPWADADPELQARCDIANEAHADAFVSIHIDSFSNSSVDGTTAYYNAKSSKDLLLAQMMHQATMNSLSIPDRGVKSNDFYVNVYTTMPSVLMEMGFITNDHRVKMLTSSWGPRGIAQSLFNGLVNYFAAIS
ncbi:N-acetylmuramoyl-L-alanine amidase family protein [Dialister succinatiphilus]|uniref:N-acetylmuramoyl-L-alanine amidase family protein n=1 Tax=Dialister succinatiphilus TaxID=487173 RepID=UPI0023547FC1|nr:N-acetylmuramoyl-L-alanine amidase [Dialister succinatiphilus]MCI6030548.1 N-acetylmuramoyl-L-alanine amidase [Dialister succinatiphilus]